MHKTFDQSVPREDQVRAVIKVATGRKHQKRPGVRAKQREENRRKRRDAIESAKQARAEAKRRDAVRAYWSGQSDELPE